MAENETTRDGLAATLDAEAANPEHDAPLRELLTDAAQAIRALRDERMGREVRTMSGAPVDWPAILMDAARREVALKQQVAELEQRLAALRAEAPRGEGEAENREELWADVETWLGRLAQMLVASGASVEDRRRLADVQERFSSWAIPEIAAIRAEIDQLQRAACHAEASLGEGEAPVGKSGVTLYYRRCSWCGVYEGVDAPCAEDQTGVVGPHKWGEYECVDPPTGDEFADADRDLVCAVWIGRHSGMESHRAAAWHLERALRRIVREESALRASRGEGEAVNDLWCYGCGSRDLAVSHGLHVRCRRCGETDHRAALRSEAPGEEVTDRLNELSYEVRERPDLDPGVVADELAALADRLRAARRGEGGEQ